MRLDDVDAAESVTARAFASAGAPSTRTPEQKQRWTHRLRRIIDADPAGCWVADDGRAVQGVAAALRRDLLWVLSTYAVDPDFQGRGAGTALLDAAIGYGAGCLRGLICSTTDPEAIRRYRRAGFTLHPTMKLTGTVQRDTLPIVEGVRDATEGDLELVDSVDRQVRGAVHGPDLADLASYSDLLVCDLLTGRGYAYVDGPRVATLAATSRAVAQRLLWVALARMPLSADVLVRTLTADQEWAIDVGFAAGLRLEHDAYLALRHMRPPAPYIPSVPFG